ncbi:MAG: hypothetical protein NTZ78_12820 [Candidatus Aureabacteria bacterium]|nr:hypothetical protein [Candidatus Auribacterota bacterium]
MNYRDILDLACAGIGAVAFILLLVKRSVKVIERRVALTLLSILLTTLAYLLYSGYQYRVSPDLLASLMIIELGVFARIYDSYRTFRSLSGTLRNLGNIYIFAGVVCLLSRSTGFSPLLWALPVILFSLGYFFMKKRRGLGNLCKGLGVLISVAFVASILYDARAGAIPGQGAALLRGHLLPDIMNPSFVEELNALNKKLSVADAEKARLSEKLILTKKESEKLTQEKNAIEGKLAEMGKARANESSERETLKTEKQKLQELLNKETAARNDAKHKLEEAKVAGKEGFTAIEEKLKLAADNLKKVMEEKTALTAELQSLRAASPMATPGSQSVDVQEMKKRLADREGELAAVTLERDRLKKIVGKIEDALPTGMPSPQVPGAGN